MANKQVIIGKTAPVPLGQQRATNSLPVVFAEDQPPIPVEEQNKVQSEVALSLLGIPRAEVALGIFADVNTYDVNPSEWSQFPIENDPETGTGVNHLYQEAGAQLVANEGRTTILTSKRFFRYQPGRVSSSTMGVKMNTTQSTYDPTNSNRAKMKGAPTIKKWGIFDKFDGYYFEIVNGGDRNDFRCVRRTQALTPYEPPGNSSTPDGWNVVVSGNDPCNITNGNWGKVGEDPVIYRNGLCYVAAAIYDPSLCYHPDDVREIEDPTNNSLLSDFTFDENYSVRLAYKKEGTDGTYVEHLEGRQFQFPFDQRQGVNPDIYDTSYNGRSGHLKPLNLVGGSDYIRLDAHCRWEDIVTNLSRGDGTEFSSEIIIAPGDGNRIDASPNDVRFGYDPAPSEANSATKVWNLLVTTLGETKITANQYSEAFPTSHRTQAYDPNDTSSAGRRNVTLKEWFKICVPPQYRTVYEWRPVRAMFSNDQLNGTTNTVRWSDVSTANVDPTKVGFKRPGDPVIINEEILTDTSVYDVDFTKVTMWKIEFSWYGAVGALFLCYVPVGNGEARWVRVHHMRASNQLDVASLGNATLPITYLTHAGLSNGLLENKSTLVKYGASYYIDGGDKGTVKLLSKSSDFAKEVIYAGDKTTVLGAPTEGTANNFLDLNIADSSDMDSLIGSYLKGDTTMQVIWVETPPPEGAGSVRAYFSGTTTEYSNGNQIELVIPRKQRAMMALRAKDEVTNTSGTPIRNRIQLYPIKYGIGISQPELLTSDNVLTINFIKNPLLITNNLNNSSLQNSYQVFLYSDITKVEDGFVLGSGTVPQEIVTADQQNISLLHAQTLGTLIPNDGDYAHCYVRGMPITSLPEAGFPSTPAVYEKAILVRIFNKNEKYYIQNYSPQNESFVVYGPLLIVKMYHFDNVNGVTTFTKYSGQIAHSKYEDQKKWNRAGVGNFESVAQLSGASVSQDFKLSPVANTGSTIFSLYANKGGSQYDLTDYFAYNKEYISYPLTDEVDILCAYAMWESTSASSNPGLPISVINSLTWEEQ